ncbi:helix-turn-helix domain-containing protein [Nocardioides sp. QY071]|uniref:helix-turn-helix domain-containing protein n=1 Tax=Nocardioides sp. QY071 TaxID=3044187 RepID=UPI00249C4466|nr:helix-turn-helix domain-containing protein [Nocardioides sp. QY071]WGY04324.1 helix-turn-helix domain-containing protein [Nocardioides sp. QY071]
MALIGTDGPAVVVSARACAFLEQYAGLTTLRVRVRGVDPQLSKELEEIRLAAMHWRGSAAGTTDDTKPEPAAKSDQWLSTGQAAELAGVTSRAIRKAIANGRLPANEIGGQYRVSREDIEHFKAARAA